MCGCHDGVLCALHAMKLREALRAAEIACGDYRKLFDDESAARTRAESVAEGAIRNMTCSDSGLVVARGRIAILEELHGEVVNQADRQQRELDMAGAYLPPSLIERIRAALAAKVGA